MSETGNVTPPILPCPFCAGPAKTDVEHFSNGDRWSVYCVDADRCGVVNEGFRDETTAIAAWNRRPDITASLTPKDTPDGT